MSEGSAWRAKCVLMSHRCVLISRCWPGVGSPVHPRLRNSDGRILAQAERASFGAMNRSPAGWSLVGCSPQEKGRPPHPRRRPLHVTSVWRTRPSLRRACQEMSRQDGHQRALVTAGRSVLWWAGSQDLTNGHVNRGPNSAVAAFEQTVPQVFDRLKNPFRAGCKLTTQTGL